MSDPEFIELLNLYVDREISAQDALRLESEVATHPRRRAIYDQYCRIQKACSMLSEETLESSPAKAGADVVAFPSPGGWRFGPVATGLAAAAAVAIAVVGLRHRELPVAANSEVSAVTPSQGRSADDVVYDRSDVDAMKPVFLVHLPAAQAAHASLLADEGSAAQASQLNWIGDIHMAPVFTSANADFILGARTDLKAAALTDPQGGRDTQEPAEMAAFRFQR